jgi:hypothetical protein
MAESQGIDRALIIGQNLDELSAFISQKTPLTETHGPHIVLDSVKLRTLFHGTTVHLCS